MKRDRSKQRSEDQPLANNEFFRRVENPTPEDAADWREDADASDADEPEPIDPAELMDWATEESEAPASLDADAEAGDDEEDDSPHEVRGSGSLLTFVGGAVAAVGAALTAIGAAIPETLAASLASLAAVGVTPFGVMLTGLIVGSVGTVRRQASAAAADQQTELRRLAKSMRAVQDAGRPGGSNPIDDETSDRLLVALQRQDEKINNLTRATKLYGKPLIDISSQVAEVASQVQDGEAIANRVRGALAETLNALDQRIEAVVRATQETRAAVGKIGEDLTTSTARVIGVTEEMQLEITEDIQKAHHEARQHFESLGTQLRDALSTAGQATSSPQFDDLEQNLSSIQREMQSLATMLARIESRPAPAASAPIPKSRPAAAPAPAAPAAAPAASEEDVPRIAGERQASGKNVLGAIAKLKSMRS